MEYIGRHGEVEVEVETDTGEVLMDVAQLRFRAQEWDDDTLRNNAVMSISMCWRFTARRITRVFSYKVAVAGADGMCCNSRKADLRRMRETFAYELRERGGDADATCWRARGVTRRTETIPLKTAKERLEQRGACQGHSVIGWHTRGPSWYNVI